MRLKQRFLYFFANQIPKTMHFHLLLYVNRNILTLPTRTSFDRGKLASFGQDGTPRRIMGGLTRKNSCLFGILRSHSISERKAPRISEREAIRLSRRKRRKKKKRHHLRNCAFLFSSGDRNILTLAPLGQDGPGGDLPI